MIPSLVADSKYFDYFSNEFFYWLNRGWRRLLSVFRLLPMHMNIHQNGWLNAHCCSFECSLLFFLGYHGDVLCVAYGVFYAVVLPSTIVKLRHKLTQHHKGLKPSGTSRTTANASPRHTHRPNFMPKFYHDKK
jgi:hypothetical protein